MATKKTTKGPAKPIKTKQGTVTQSYGPAGIQISVSNAPQKSLQLSEWRTAIDSARSARMPRRRLLLDLFENIRFDGHLEAVSEKRKLSITTQSIQFATKGGKGRTDDYVKDEILDTQWFGDLLFGIMGSIDYGYALLELVPGEGGKIKKVDDLDKRNVLIDYQYLAWDFNTFEPAAGMGIYYLEDPELSDYLIEIKSRYKLGKLATAALLIILKRGGIADWAEFCQIVGIPPRIGKYNAFDDYGRTKLSEAFSKMGSNGYLVIPEGTSVEFASTNTSGSSTNVFQSLAEFCNSELSKLYLGQTMTTDQGSSRSQGEVHKDVEEMINLADKIWVEAILNNVVKEKLIKIGYKIPEGKFHFPETSAIPLTERIKIDVDLDKIIPFPEEYWYNTYGVPKPTADEAAKWEEKKAANNAKTDAPPIPAVEPKPKEKPTKAKLMMELNSIYKIASPTGRSQWPISESSKELDKIWDRIVIGIHNGQIKPGSVDKDLFEWIKKELIAGVIVAMGDKYAQDLYKVFLEKITKNVQVFSGFKTYQTLRAATDMLRDDNGNLREFSAFKSLVQAVNETYNVTYLEAEYNQAVAAAQMGAKWQSMWENRAAAGMLRLDTAGDSRVREDHAKLDKITLPITDSFWDHYYPPLDWGCRCDVTEQLNDEPRTELPSNLPKIKDQFAVNWGKKGILFPENHPYYNVRPEDQDAADKLWGLTNE